ncbi:MAG: PAS domain S-box protein [Candidatus Lokiarchaeota archaeon]|nr:PAS domain S-box protein [Candidatus Lokiarchaeota archaeon]
MSLANILIKSPKKLKSFLNTIPIPIYAWQNRQNNLFLIDYNNAAYLETNGEIKNKLGSIASEYYKENIDLMRVLKECANKSTSISKDIKYFCNISNEVKSLLVKTDFIPPDFILVQTINRTKQNLLEQKAKESEEISHLITENANDILIMTNEKYEAEYVNEQALKNLLGYSKEEIIGFSGLDFIHPDDIKTALLSVKKGIEDGQAVTEIRYRHKEGYYVWMEAIGKTFTGIRGELKGIIILRDIAKRKSIEFKLKESEENYRLITEQSNDLIRVLNEKFEMEYVNEISLKNLLGYTKQELLGKNSSMLNHPNDYKKVRRFMVKLFKYGENTHETRIKHKNGNWVWVENKAKMFTDEKGDQKYLFISRDITERKKTEKALKESEEKYRHLFENSPYMIILINEKGDLIDFNQNTLKYLKDMNKNDLIGKNFLNLNFIPLKHIKKLKTIYKDLFHKGFSDTFEFQMDILNKNLIEPNLEWIEVQTAMVKVGDANLIQVIITDISERKKVEEKIRESEELFQKFFEESQDGVTLTDENGIIIKWNKEQERMSGIQKKDRIGQLAWEAFYRDMPEKYRTFKSYNLLKSILENFFKTGKAPWLNKLQEIDVQSADGSYQCIQLLPFSIRTKKGFMLGSINRNITEQKKIRQKLLESEEKYRVAYDQADFYKNLFAHDISNILFVINGSSQLCSLFLEDPEKAKDVKVNLTRIREQVMRAKLLIKNVQRMSEINSDKPVLKSIDICKSLTKCIKYINECYEGKSVEISVDSGITQIFVFANDLILDVFENLLINAIKHNQNSIKKITIRLTKEEKDGVQFLKMEFIDNAIGITNERKENIFQKGHKKDEYTKGMGIGLTLVKILIDRYHGFIWVEDKVPGDYSKGSNFILLIPLASSEN